MRVTFVQPYVTTNAGPQRYYNIQSFGLARELARCGHHVTIITSSSAGQGSSGMIRRMRWSRAVEDGFEVEYVPVLADLKGLPILPTLVSALSRSQPSVVQAAEDFQPMTALSALWCARKNVPLVVFQGVYCIPERHRWLRSLLYRTVGAAAYRHADAFICKSAAARNFVVSRGARPECTHVIPVGFRRDHYRRVESDYLRSRVGPHRQTIVSVGRLTAVKGYDIAIRAMRLVVARHPDAAYLILGRGEEEGSLRRLIAANDLSDSVFIETEMIPNMEIARVYSDACLSLMPSRFEIFGMTILESLGCGCPVVASRVGGMPDIVQDGVTGVLFDPEDPRDLASQICTLLADPGCLATLSAQASRSADRFDWSSIGGRFATVYEALVGS